MTAQRPALPPWWAGLILLANIAAPTAASGQYISPDPYKPWNTFYQPYVFPTPPGFNGAIPNQSRLGMFGGGTNQFGAYLDSIRGIDSNPFGLSTRGSNRGVPYYQAGRLPAQVGTATDPRYTPNPGDTFRQEQAERQRLFFEALRERDPRKRAELMRQVEQGRLRAARSASDPLAAEPTPRTRTDPFDRTRPGAAPRPGDEPPVPPAEAAPAAGPGLLRPLAPAGVAPVPPRSRFDEPEEEDPEAASAAARLRSPLNVPDSLDQLLDEPPAPRSTQRFLPPVVPRTPPR